ncbi:MAG TPA: hypothetical protein VF485_02545 [Sphingomonas sp.]
MLWARPETRWIIVGELHGTNETPDAFTNLVCLAAESRGAVTVAIEYPIDMQSVLDAWLDSDGGEAARAALLAGPFWRSPQQDGRTSIAFLHMLDRLRLMHRAGTVRSVRGFDMPSDGSDERDRNAAMADRLTKIADTAPGLTMVLVGDYHAIVRELPSPRGPVRPAAFLLPAGKRISVDVVGAGGSMWNCQMQGCHRYDFAPRPAGPARIEPDRDPDHRYDAIYTLGKPTTAAEPAVPGIADTSPLDPAMIKP